MKVKKIFFLKVVIVLIPVIFFSAILNGNDQDPNSENEEKNKVEALKLKKPVKVIVSATKIETPREEIGSSITVIDSTEIRNSQKTSVVELLRNVPAIDVVQTGGPGRAVSIFIRGAKSEHTLVLIDGVEMNDPISPGRSYDFANLSVDNLDRIEIIRGPQSTLYGSDAIGGVINFITKNKFNKPEGFLSTEFGSYKSFIEKMGFTGGSEKFYYSMGFSRIDSEGISSAGEKYGNTENDSYGLTSFSGKIGFSPNKNLDMDVMIRYIDAKSHIDNFGGKGGDDPNNITFANQFFLRVQSKYSLFDGKWEQKIGFSYSNHDRKYVNGTDSLHPFDSSQEIYKGQVLKVDWQNNFIFHSSNIATIGIDIEEEKGNSEYESTSIWGPFSSIFENRKATTSGVYFQDMIKLKNVFFATLGIRIDNHNQFGTETTYRVTTAYNIKSTSSKFRASYGSGFKAPTLFQLFSQYGYEDLLPEKSTGLDIGFEQDLFGRKLTFGAVYFKNKFKELIDFNSSTFKYINITEARTEGVELFSFFKPVDALSIRMNFTYTNSENEATGEKLLRRPAYKFGIDTNFNFYKKGNFNVNLLFIGKRYDMDFSTWPSQRVLLDKYVLLNIALTYPLNEKIHLSGHIANVLNSDYEEVLGYGTPGISVFARIKWIFK